MAGKRGMHRTAPRRDTLRFKLWTAMRILRRFSLADLCRTSGATYSNARKFLARLTAHGYAAPSGAYTAGRPGEYRGWRLVDDIGPNYPTVCSRCGRPLSDICGGGQ